MITISNIGAFDKIIMDKIGERYFFEPVYVRNIVQLRINCENVIFELIAPNVYLEQ